MPGIDGALYDAIRDSKIKEAEELIELGANVNKNAYGIPLIKALDAKENKVEMIQLLIAHGADVNVRGMSDYTPLMMAVEKGDIEVVRILLEHGADPHLINSRKETAMDLARKFFNKDILLCFKDKGLL